MRKRSYASMEHEDNQDTNELAQEFSTANFNTHKESSLPAPPGENYVSSGRDMPGHTGKDFPGHGNNMPRYGKGMPGYGDNNVPGSEVSSNKSWYGKGMPGYGDNNVPGSEVSPNKLRPNNNGKGSKDASYVPKGKCMYASDASLAKTSSNDSNIRRFVVASCAEAYNDELSSCSSSMKSEYKPKGGGFTHGKSNHMRFKTTSTDVYCSEMLACSTLVKNEYQPKGEGAYGNCVYSSSSNRLKTSNHSRFKSTSAHDAYCDEPALSTSSSFDDTRPSNHKRFKSAPIEGYEINESSSVSLSLKEPVSREDKHFTSASREAHGDRFISSTSTCTKSQYKGIDEYTAKSEYAYADDLCTSSSSVSLFDPYGMLDPHFSSASLQQQQQQHRHGHGGRGTKEVHHEGHKSETVYISAHVGLQEKDRHEGTRNKELCHGAHTTFCLCAECKNTQESSAEHRKAAAYFAQHFDNNNNNTDTDTACFDHVSDENKKAAAYFRQNGEGDSNKDAACFENASDDNQKATAYFEQANDESRKLAAYFAGGNKDDKTDKTDKTDHHVDGECPHETYGYAETAYDMCLSDTQGHKDTDDDVTLEDFRAGYAEFEEAQWLTRTYATLYKPPPGPPE
jgi:hypothetical protein